jgi:MFS family permease
MAGFFHIVALGPLPPDAKIVQDGGVTTTATPPATRPKLHRAWLVAGVAFVAILGAAGFRATPGVLITPLEEEFGWSRGTISLAVSVNLILFGITAPFAAALMDRFGIRRVVSGALLLIAAGSGLTVFMTTSWQLVLTWGVLWGSAPDRWRSSSSRRSPGAGSSSTAVS